MKKTTNTIPKIVAMLLTNRLARYRVIVVLRLRPAQRPSVSNRSTSVKSFVTPVMSLRVAMFQSGDHR